MHDTCRHSHPCNSPLRPAYAVAMRRAKCVHQGLLQPIAAVVPLVTRSEGLTGPSWLFPGAGHHHGMPDPCKV